jgi:integrase
MDLALKGLYKRNGIYWLRWTPFKGQGQRRTTLHTDELQEAIEEARKFRDNPNLAGIGTWEDELKDFKKNTHNTASYKRSTGSVVERFFNWLEEEQKRTFTLGEITADDVSRFLLQGFSNTTLLTYKATLVGFFNYLQRENKVRNNPAANVLHDGKLTLKTAEKFVDKETTHRLIHCPPEDWAPLRSDLKFVLFLGLKCGLRKDEIIHSTHKWFILDSHTITIPDSQNVGGWNWKPKTRKGRSIPMTEDFHHFLSTEFPIKKGVEEFCLHPEAKGRKRYAKKPVRHPRRYRWDFRRPLEEYLKAQGITDINTHALRHSFASNCLRAGIHIGIVAKMIGDSISTTEKIYANFRPRRGELDHVF